MSEINYDNPKHKKFIDSLRKQSALEELERLEKSVFNLENGKVGKLIDTPKFDYKYYIHERIKELKEGVFEK
jgi:hypothetical protein